MAKTFTLLVNSDPVKLVSELKSRLKGKEKIQFNGDENGGMIEGKGFRGKYSLIPTGAKTKVVLTIEKKPFAIPWGLIESKIRAEAEKW